MDSFLVARKSNSMYNFETGFERQLLNYLFIVLVPISRE